MAPRSPAGHARRGGWTVPAPSVQRPPRARAASTARAPGRIRRPAPRACQRLDAPHRPASTRRTRPARRWHAEASTASTGRPAGSAAPPPAPDRREGGGPAPTGPPLCQVASHVSTEFRAPGGHNSPLPASCRVTANRPKPDRARPRSHRVRAIPAFRPFDPCTSPAHTPVSDAPLGPEPPESRPEEPNSGGRRDYARNSAVITPPTARDSGIFPALAPAMRVRSIAWHPERPQTDPCTSPAH